MAVTQIGIAGHFIPRRRVEQGSAIRSCHRTKSTAWRMARQFVVPPGEKNDHKSRRFLDNASFCLTIVFSQSYHSDGVNAEISRKTSINAIVTNGLPLERISNGLDLRA